MDDKKENEMNTNEVNNDFKYSFDFSNQVDNPAVPAAEPVAPASPAPAAEPVAPVEPVPVAEPVAPAESVQNQSNGDEELIKDKKETTRFLLLILVLLIVFIVALPFVLKILG